MKSGVRAAPQPRRPVPSLALLEAQAGIAKQDGRRLAEEVVLLVLDERQFAADGESRPALDQAVHP